VESSGRNNVYEKNLFHFWECVKKCGGEHYLKEELGQRYCISRLEDNGGQFLLHRVDCYYCTKVLLWKRLMPEPITFQFNRRRANTVSIYKISISIKFYIFFCSSLIHVLFSFFTECLVREHVVSISFWGGNSHWHPQRINI